MPEAGYERIGRGSRPIAEDSGKKSAARFLNGLIMQMLNVEFRILNFRY